MPLKNLIRKIIPQFLISGYHFCWAFLGAVYYRFPSRRLVVIGVTGTHGKTTVVNLATTIFEKAGYKVAAASSIKFKIADREEENKLKMTMPGRARLQKFLRDTLRAGCKYAILEVTSEGVLQHRHRFIKFDVMVFTNLYRDHLERHGGFENYRAAKAEYFKKCKNVHIINADDNNAEYFLRFPANEKILFSIIQHPMSNDWLMAENIGILGNGIKFKVKDVEFNLKLQGEFNVYNALTAIAIAMSRGVSLENCKQALELVKGIAGRMEQIINAPFRVIVDYAFTPDALEQVYKTLKVPSSKFQVSRLVCVLGACGGGRDKWKRPELGKIAKQYCKEIIITNEDPYDEDPMEIIGQVARGAGEKALKILDRREAIRKALELARANDTVIITGKGCEPWICEANNKKISWDDRQIVRQEFSKLS